MKLALKRGISHAELMRTTDAAEIGEYMALNMIDPLFEGERAEVGIANLTAAVCNLWRDGDARPMTVQDWLPDYAARFKPAEQNEDEIRRALDSWLGPA